MTVTEYLKFVTELKGVPRKNRENEVERVIEVTQLNEMRNRLIQHLSKGYRRRVGIAQALVGNPEVIILDEPTVGLDPKQIIEIRDLMKALAKEHTVLLSSHIMQEISAVCDHIMIISHGKLVLSGTPEELQAQANQGENLELEVCALKEQVTDILNGFSAISDVTEIAAEKENGYAVCIKSAEDIREALFFAFAKAGLPVIKFVRNTKTLEDIFLEATAEKPETDEMFADGDEPEQQEEADEETTPATEEAEEEKE